MAHAQRVMDVGTARATARDAVLLIGSGDRLYREYVCASIAERHRLVLLQSTPATWQRPYVVEDVVVDLDDADAVVATARACRARHALRGVLTYDETRVRLAAELAARLGIAHLDGGAAARCRDKLATRRALARAGVPSAGARHVATLSEARAAAAELGYPVVLKPRGLAGSIGVVRVDAPDALAAAYEQARGSRLEGVAALPGLLVEEYLEGPEISVDCVVVDGHAQVATVARKRLGFAPFFEEVGHVVSCPDDASLPLDEIRAVVAAAQRALGIDRGVTHSELRLTPSGPRIIEVNARLGGDLIPHLGRLAGGVDLAAAAADVAVGERPRIERTRSRAAAIRFFYPRADARVRALGLDPAWRPSPWLERLCWEAAPGDVLRLPPAGFLSRLGFAIVTGADMRECDARLDEVERHLRVDVEAPPPARPGPAATGAGAGSAAPRREGGAAAGELRLVAPRPGAARWQASPPADPSGGARHVFDTSAWLRAWERATAERHLERAYLCHDEPGGGVPATPFYLVADSPMWGSYETDAGVGPVWPGPVVMTPSLYAFYGATDAPPRRAAAIVDHGLEQARRWGGAAFVVGNLEPDAAVVWAGQAPPTVATVLDKSYRADVSGGVDGHLARLDGHARREFRRQWRRGVARGLTLQALRGEAMLPRLAELDALAEDTSRRHGPPLYTLPTFRALSAVPGATLLVADIAGEAAGAFLTFLHGESLYLWAGGYDHARRAELGTYSFLLYESIRFAVSNGRRYVEAGRGNFRFKERHGFVPTELWSLVYVMPGPDHDELRARLLEMDRGLQAHLPPAATLCVG